jgi:TatA/E family protein of Tat protein translocase
VHEFRCALRTESIPILRERGTVCSKVCFNRCTCHLLVILGIAALVFGPKKIPELGKRLGGGIRSFKSALQTDEG